MHDGTSLTRGPAQGVTVLGARSVCSALDASHVPDPREAVLDTAEDSPVFFCNGRPESLRK